MNRWLGLSPTPGYIVLLLELAPIVLIYLLLMFMSSRGDSLSNVPFSAFIQRPLGSALIFLTFSIFAFKKARQLRSQGSVDSLVRIPQFVGLLLLLSAPGNLLQSFLLSQVSHIGELQAFAHAVIALDVVGVIASTATVIAVWSLYWALKTSPLEEIGAFASILIVGGLAVLWAQAGSIPGASDWMNMLVVGLTTAEFALDLLAMVLLCGLFMGKQFRTMTISWRMFVCFVAGAVGVTLIQDRWAYEAARNRGPLTVAVDPTLLSLLDAFLWLMVAAFWALAVLNIHAGALTEGGTIEAAAGDPATP
jgi:hypothetical protein